MARTRNPRGRIRPVRVLDHALPPLTGDASTDVAISILTEAVRAGVRDVVVCPGSRSQALALVAAELERAEAITLHVRFDERSAGFFALGISRETRRPVPVIVTSGTAVANLHPAMLEAHHAGVPLVALTADRPPELVGVGANQATVQPGLFGEAIECIHLAPLETAAEYEIGDALEPARAFGTRIAHARRALHANVAFRDPLSVAIPSLSDWASTLEGAPEPVATTPVAPEGLSTVPVAQVLADDTRTLVVAGADAGPVAEQIAAAGQWPLIAEASSGARFGPDLIVSLRHLLGEASDAGLRDEVQRLIITGHPTLSREVPKLMNRDDVEVIVVTAHAGKVGSDAAVSVRADAIQVVEHDDETVREAHRAARRAWLNAFRRADRAVREAESADAPAPNLEAATSTDARDRAAFGRAEAAIGREPVTREVLVDAVWRATWPHDRLVLGASRLIRVLDERVGGKPIRVHANRGLAGIDGTIATALGVATASQGESAPVSSRAGMTRALMGDLTFLHDASSLLVGQGGEGTPRVQLIVGNDNGGTIFAGLEVAGTAGQAFDRVMLTPQRADIAAIANAYGWAHVPAATRRELDMALSDHTRERVVIEVPLAE